MNKITLLLEKQYVLDFFRKKVLPKYPDFVDIKNIIIKKHKNNIWPKTYHVVFEFITTFKKGDNTSVAISIFCSAHSDEPRRNAYIALRYLWKQDFSASDLTIPRALFYDNYFKAIFYQSVEGTDLHSFIRQRNYKEIELIIPCAAKWFAKLHRLPTKKAPNFNPKNSRIKTVIPGSNYILKRIKIKYPQHFNFYKAVYNIFIKREEDFLSKNKLWLVHGDAHPGNIIKINHGIKSKASSSEGIKIPRVGVIDFTDLCLSDFARDFGTFFQQVDYMVGYKNNDAVHAERIKKFFLKSYLKHSKIKMTKDLQERIDNYYNWTAMRTATFLLLRDNSNKDRVCGLLNGVAERMNF